MREYIEKRNKKPLTFLVLQTVINYNNNNSNFICTEIDKNKIIKGPLGCLVSVKKRLKYTLLNSYYKSKCFARPQKACMLFRRAIFTGSSLKTFAPLKK